jgi:signal transduction histidine kinase
VSHELRNPLGVISNSIYFLGKLLPQTDEKTTEYLGIIASETRRAEKIITDLLDYSRIKSPEREPVDINDLIVKTLKRYSPPENISVEISMPEIHSKVLADAIQIGQVLGNLIENACQAMPDGGTLSLSGDIRKIKNDSYLALAIKDTGAGISSKNMKHLFEPLYTTKQRGIGLGLAISKNLIEGSGGWIEASSQAGKGSVFTIYLPFVQE